LTILEGMIVTGLITVLMALLFPVMRVARQSAQAASCASSLRQIGMVNALYAGEHNGWYVPIHQPGKTAGEKIWWYQDEDFRALANVGVPAFSGGAHYPKRFICPAATWAFETAEKGYPRIDRSYGFNETRVLILRGYSGVPLAKMGPFGVRKTEVSRPAEIIQMADSLGHTVDRPSASAYTAEQEPPGGQGKVTAYRHRGKANLLFFDGHVESLGREVLGNEQTNEKPWVIQ